MTPEAKAREVIDKKLEEVGYVIQDMNEFNPAESLGVAVREFPTNSGPVDYLLFINRMPVGVIEAKRTEEGQNLVSVAEQSLRYVESGLKYVVNQPKLRFAYEATDVIVRFCDYADEKAKSREVFTFHKPEFLLELLKEEDTLRNRLKRFPEFDSTGFRKCQATAIENLEKSFQENKPRALIQMATGAGKTFTAISSVYRLLKYGKAKRILFLVDTKNLGEQAEEEFRKYKPNDDSRLFPELYNVVRLNSSNISEDTHVCISTIQRMYSILRGEFLDENSEEISPSEIDYTHQRPKEVMYNTKYSPDFFDFIIIDECHRSIYNVWQQVLDYFDAFLIGLTATPDNRTYAFFNQNIVSEYTHEQAVIDDVNVGRQGTYVVETEIGQNGATITKDLAQTIQIRERLSRKKRWTQLDEDIDYKPSQLDADKAALQKELGLDADPDAFLLGIVSRLTDQKGMDLVLPLLEKLTNGPSQLIVLGTGERHYEDSFRLMAGARPNRMAVVTTYDEPLSHRIYAGIDAFLMPSRFEPCGLSQLIALRYGALPIVRATGGLKDTVRSLDKAGDAATGFMFEDYDVGGLNWAVDLAMRTFYDDRKTWEKMRRNAMREDFSWSRSAEEYSKLYDEVMK